ncbi:hypothetical protein V8G54_016194 [Vigna mungo]|uniref:Uncharacterized protein n=1 Tax=Vigna mungo TaxID=3915 RepID=A0AAQ3RXL9_VIGMU
MPQHPTELVLPVQQRRLSLAHSFLFLTHPYSINTITITIIILSYTAEIRVCLILKLGIWKLDEKIASNYPSSTCFRWQCLPDVLRLAGPPASDGVSQWILISLHSLLCSCHHS